MVLAASRGGKDIKDYKACNDDDTSVHFEITMTEKQEEGEKAKIEWKSAKTVVEELVFKAHYMSIGTEA
nr:hypothetical protein [Tanacetum cinerariifolium]